MIITKLGHYNSIACLVLYLGVACDQPVSVMHGEHPVFVVVQQDLVGRCFRLWPSRLCVVLLRDDARVHTTIGRGEDSSADRESEWMSRPW